MAVADHLRSSLIVFTTSFSRHVAAWRRLHVSPKALTEACGHEKTPFLDSLYSHEETKRLLDVFNTWSVDNLQRVKGLTGKRIESIVRDRAHRGPHTTLAGVSQSTGITVLALERICRSLLSGAASGKPKLPSVAAPPAMLFSPVVSTELYQKAEHFVSLCFSDDSIFWSQLSAPSRLMDLNTRSLWDTAPKPTRLDVAAYAEAIGKIIDSVPKSSIYVTEKSVPKYFRGSSSQSILTANVVGALTLGMLCGSSNVINKPRVVSLAPQALTRRFKLLIGGERVSSQGIAQDLIRNGRHENVVLDVPAFIKDSYFQQDDATKERLLNCLLQAIIFMELVRPLSMHVSIGSTN